MSSMRRVYLDCDGVLADFHTAFERVFGYPPGVYEDEHGSEVFWRDIRSEAPDFFRQLPLTADARQLFEGVEHLRPLILTGSPPGGWAEPQKLAWSAEHFPGIPMVICTARDKRAYCKPCDILVDDCPHYRDRWEQAGGHFVHHTSAAQSLGALRQLGVEG